QRDTEDRQQKSASRRKPGPTCLLLGSWKVDPGFRREADEDFHLCVSVVKNLKGDRWLIAKSASSSTARPAVSAPPSICARCSTSAAKAVCRSKTATV